MGLKQFFRIPLLVDLKLNIFLVYHPEMGLFQSIERFTFRKREFNMLKNMMQNVENMTKHWSSLDLGFCIALFPRNLPYQPSASWRGTSCSISGLGDRILPSIEKISMLISVSFEPLARFRSILPATIESSSPAVFCEQLTLVKTTEKMDQTTFKNCMQPSISCWCQNTPGIIWLTRSSSMAVHQRPLVWVMESKWCFLWFIWIHLIFWYGSNQFVVLHLGEGSSVALTCFVETLDVASASFLNQNSGSRRRPFKNMWVSNVLDYTSIGGS